MTEGKIGALIRARAKPFARLIVSVLSQSRSVSIVRLVAREQQVVVDRILSSSTVLTGASQRFSASGAVT
ncbi:MAG: hypothetical protein ACXV2E_02585, partial [Halobacteriota archaeon]